MPVLVCSWGEGEKRKKRRKKTGPVPSPFHHFSHLWLGQKGKKKKKKGETWAGPFYLTSPSKGGGKGGEKSENEVPLTFESKREREKKKKDPASLLYTFRAESPEEKRGEGKKGEKKRFPRLPWSTPPAKKRERREPITWPSRCTRGKEKKGGKKSPRPNNFFAAGKKKRGKGEGGTEGTFLHSRSPHAQAEKEKKKKKKKKGGGKEDQKTEPFGFRDRLSPQARRGGKKAEDAHLREP